MKKGFTLCELVVVCVILGLISGFFILQAGLFTHKELESIAIEFQTYNIAVDRFKKAYDYYPGDIPNATNYWFHDIHCSGVAGIPGYCNGDGDRLISDNVHSFSNNEALRAWQHLLLAHMLPDYHRNPLVHAVPQLEAAASHGARSNVRKGKWRFYSDPSVSLKDNFLKYGIKTDENSVMMPALTPKEAYYLDYKMDDGVPRTGIVQAQYPGETSCVDVKENQYNIDVKDTICTMFFVLNEKTF